MLLEVARAALHYGAKASGIHQPDPADFSAALRTQRACFVTLQLAGKLRGCVGTLEAHGALVVEVARAAHNAGFEDPRFAPLKSGEIEQIDIHVSVLSAATPMTFANEDDLLSQLRPGVDGLILTEGGRSGTFLPSVWESLPAPREFLGQLKRKAGLPVGYWSPTLQIQRYATQSFGR